MASQRLYGSARSPSVSMSAFRRNTVQLARDVLLSNFRSSLARPDPHEEYNRLVHEANGQLAAYRSAGMLVGTGGDSWALRKDLASIRASCLKTCDSTKNCVLPQLKSESHESVQSSEFTGQASQFIGCLSIFLTEMRRTLALLLAFPAPPSALPPPPGAPSAPEEDRVPLSPSPPTRDQDQDLAALQRDIEEVEKILETLENLITVHFSTKDCDQEAVKRNSRGRRKGCRNMGNLCASFKTSYA